MVKPLCPYFGQCGGCSLQHIEYAGQLENKKKALASAITFSDISVFHGSEYNYRNRMDFVFHSSGLGLRKKREWYTIIDIEKCAISDERLNELLQEVKKFFKNADVFDVRKKNGTFRYAVIRTPQNDSSICFILNENSPRLREAVEKIREFSETTNAKNILVGYVPADSDKSISDNFFVIKRRDMLSETYLGKEFIYSAQGFFQNNSNMAEKMQEYVNNLLKKYNTKNSFLLDLYAGVGTFGIINSELFREVYIVESDKNCIDAAKLNIASNQIKNAKEILLDAMKLKKLTLPKDLFVITDPPRSGMHPKTIEQLKSLKPKVIIYVSCNIEQLSKDLKKFSDYKVKSAALFDLFPQTPHMEAVIELVLN